MKTVLIILFLTLFVKTDALVVVSSIKIYGHRMNETACLLVGGWDGL